MEGHEGVQESFIHSYQGSVHPQLQVDKTVPRNELLRYKAYTLTDEEERFYKSNVIVDMFQAFDICKKTITQSKSDFWFQQRKIRITASKAHSILR